MKTESAFLLVARFIKEVIGILKIAVYTQHPEEDVCKDLVSLLQEQLSGAEILLPSFEDVFYGRGPENLQTAFVCVDKMHALEGERKLQMRGIPLVFISVQNWAAPVIDQLIKGDVLVFVHRNAHTQVHYMVCIDDDEGIKCFAGMNNTSIFGSSKLLYTVAMALIFLV